MKTILATKHAVASHVLLLVGCFLLVSAASSAPAVAQTYTTIDYPGAPNSFATDINDSGQIVGEYTFVGLGDRQGYLLSNGVFTSISYPGATFTRAVAYQRQRGHRRLVRGQYRDARVSLARRSLHVD